MTEVFISALSTTRLDLNEEDLQYYVDQKNKEILQVRQCLEFLHSFTSLPIKERPQADLELAWKCLNILAKILGYEAQFREISKLQLPQSILLQDIITSDSLFLCKNYRPFQVVYRWNGKVDNYLILLEGVMERQLHKSSILDTGSGNPIPKENGSRLKKSNRKRYGRTDEQIPICLNSKRNQMRIIDFSSGFFRSLTPSYTFQVDAIAWKKYVATFQKLEEHYILNFIRKKLNISLNLDLYRVKGPKQIKEAKQNQPELKEETSQKIYLIESCERKRQIELNSSSIFLLYVGEMLVETANYKIQTSRGCVLNTSIFEQFTNKQQTEVDAGKALSKTDSILIHIDIQKLKKYLEWDEKDQKSLQALLQTLENTRKSSEISSVFKHKKKESDKIESDETTQNSKSLKIQYSVAKPQFRAHHQSLAKLISSKSKKTVFLPNCKHNTLDNSMNKQKNKIKKMFQCEQIENKVSKREKVAELIKTQSLKKSSSKLRRTTFENINYSYDQCTSILKNDLFKDCLSCIQTKNDMIKKVICMYRKSKIKTEPNQNKNDLSASKNVHSPFRDNSSQIIKRRIKEVYQRTEEECYDSGELFSCTNKQFGRNKPTRYTINDSFAQCKSPRKEQKSTYDEQMFKERGRLRKVQKGYLRRIKIRG